MEPNGFSKRWPIGIPLPGAGIVLEKDVMGGGAPNRPVISNEHLRVPSRQHCGCRMAVDNEGSDAAGVCGARDALCMWKEDAVPSPPQE